MIFIGFLATIWVAAVVLNLYDKMAFRRELRAAIRAFLNEEKE